MAFYHLSINLQCVKPPQNMILRTLTTLKQIKILRYHCCFKQLKRHRESDICSMFGKREYIIKKSLITLNRVH